MDEIPVEVVSEEMVPTPVKRVPLRRHIRNALLFLPNMVKLSYRLMRDSRVSKADKVVLAASIIYVISPLDFIPDMIPFIGQIDDTYLIAIALLRLYTHTEAGVVQSHWDGGGDIHSFLTKIANLTMFFLPKRVQRALVGRVHTPESVKDFASYAAKRQPKKQTQ